MSLPLSHAEMAAWLRLSLEPGLGPVGARRLAERAGTPLRLYADPPAGTPLTAQLAAPAPSALQRRIDAALAWAERPGHRLLVLDDPAYPDTLRACPDAPPVLYAAGDPGRLARPALAVVGARHATPGGQEDAHAFARHLAGRGWCIVSGLALGIDGAAHEGALAAGPTGGGTIAVVATGIDVVYPARHRALARRIEQAGLLLSEMPLGSPAAAHRFPRRNRLVAGLSRGVVVVEAAVHSGSLITARLAADLGREVFALPGSIHSPLSRGCHALIRQGAKLVETALDIEEELAPVAPAPARAGAVAPPDPVPGRPGGGAGDPLLAAMGFSPVHPDTLARRCGLDAASLQARLLTLELAGLVAPCPGGRYQRTARPG